MRIIPGLTTTRQERIPAFLNDLRRSSVREIACFPTCLTVDERPALYRELETIDGLTIPHVHVRTDFTGSELDYLSDRFGTLLFNIHPARSTHPFGEIPATWRSRFFIENVAVVPEASELSCVGGLCPDFAHLESARCLGVDGYERAMRSHFETYPVGCCHVSAIRVGEPNDWNGAWDHHAYTELSNFDYLLRYRDRFPDSWVSLELENCLAEQLAAAAYIRALLGVDEDYTPDPQTID